ncbi:MAG: hypothetical protein WBM14_17335 [Terracidiphilus sp.]|jgi:hypothetical protein
MNAKFVHLGAATFLPESWLLQSARKLDAAGFPLGSTGIPARPRNTSSLGAVDLVTHVVMVTGASGNLNATNSLNVVVQ